MVSLIIQIVFSFRLTAADTASITKDDATDQKVVPGPTIKASLRDALSSSDVNQSIKVCESH